MNSISIILDTDIGPDCDDAGALALLHILAKDRPVRLLAVTNCTSNPYGNGAIDAINRAYGQYDIPIGMYDKPGFLCDEASEVYNKAICLGYENRFQYNQKAPRALDVLKTALQQAEDKAIVVAIGPLNNLADLLRDAEGRHLVAQKVKLLVTMSCGLDSVEWNIKMDIPSAQEVFANWPTPIIATPFETGEKIITGADFQSMSDDHPVRLAYRLFTGQDDAGRSSWDLTAVWMAIVGVEPFFSLSEAYDVHISDSGQTIYKPHPDGKLRFLLNKLPVEEIGRSIDSLWY